jgi:type IV secretion system protein VirB6
VSAAVTGVATLLSGNIDAALAKYLAGTAAALAAGLAPLIIIGITMWIALYGMAVMRGEVNDPFNIFVKNVIRISFIVLFALSSAIYQTYVVDSVDAFITFLIQTISPNGPGDIFQTLDAFNSKMVDVGTGIIRHGTSNILGTGLLDVLAGLLVLLAQEFLFLGCCGMSIVGKTALAFVLAFGPLFIAALAFPQTTKFFDAWLSKVVNYILLLTFYAAISAFCVTVTTDYADAMIAGADTDNAIAAAFGLVGLVGALLILVWHVPQLAAALSGGTPLSGSGLIGYMAGAMTRNRQPRSPNSDGDDKTRNSNSVSAGEGIPAYRRATLDRMSKK